MNQQPYPAYSVRSGSQRDYWTRVGAAFPNRNGGFTVGVTGQASY